MLGRPSIVARLVSRTDLAEPLSVVNPKGAGGSHPEQSWAKLLAGSFRMPQLHIQVSLGF
jgi:hypothetical protein